MSPSSGLEEIELWRVSVGLWNFIFYIFIEHGEEEGMRERKVNVREKY